MIEWKQEGTKVFFEYDGEEIYFMMPEDFKLSETHEDTLKLCEILLLSKWHPSVKEHNFSRTPGKNNGLSMSTGVDSTACMLLLPEDTKLAYMERDFESMLIHDNAYKFIEECDREILVIKSNHEKIRTHHDLRPGFSADVACSVHLVLMADYLDLKSISMGTVLENGFLNSGYKFRDFSEADDAMYWIELFKKAGLDLVFPVIGTSEIVTSKIVEESKYRDLAYPCLRKFGGCDNCFKCYRKKLLKGIQLEINREADLFMRKRPPKMISPIIYSMKKYGFKVPQVEEFMYQDYTFLEKYYPRYLDFIPGYLKQRFIDRLEEFGIEPMNEEDIKNLKEVDLK